VVCALADVAVANGIITASIVIIKKLVMYFFIFIHPF